MSYTPGNRQAEILKAIERDGWFLADTRSLQRSCMNLHQHGYLARDPQNSFRWALSEKFAAQTSLSGGSQP